MPIRSPSSAGLPQVAPQAKASEARPQPAQAKVTGRTVQFELYAHQAGAVSVVGTFNDWKPGVTPLIARGGGKWAKELPLPPGRYEYRFVVDGKWMDDPKAKASVPNPHGGRNAVLEVS